MAFMVQGKEMSIGDMTKLIEHVTAHKILERLEVEEISSFLRRLMEWYEKQIKLNLQVEGTEEGFLNEQAKSRCSTWEKGKNLMSHTISKNQLIEFISIDFSKMLIEKRHGIICIED